MMCTRVPSLTTIRSGYRAGRPRAGRKLGWGWKFSPQTLFGPSQGDFESLRAERLEQVIHGVDVEGAQSVLIVGRHKYDRHFCADQLENLKAVQLGHLNIEKDQIGFQLARCLDRFKAVGALGDDLDLGMSG
jgi:hypothetical protein